MYTKGGPWVFLVGLYSCTNKSQEYRRLSKEDLAYLEFLWRWNLVKETTHQGWTLGLSSLGLGTCLPCVLSSLWSYVEAYQGQALDFVNLWGLPSVELGFVESCVQCKWWALAYMALVMGGMYWRCNGLLLHTYPYKLACTRGIVVWISRTHQGWTLGFAIPLEDWLGNCSTWVLGTVLLHTCHLLWLARTEDVVICLCIYVTCCGWHILELLGYAYVCMPFALGGMHYKLNSILLHICHSSWMAYTRLMNVICSCMYVTRHGWHTLETGCSHTHMSLIVGDLYWRLSSILLHICHSSWVAYTGVVIVIFSCMYVTRCGWHTLEMGCAREHMSLVVHICHSSWVAYTGVMVVIHSCMYVTHHRLYTLELWW